MIFGRDANPADVKEVVGLIKRTKMPTIGAFFTAIEAHDEIASLAHFVDVPTHILVGSKDRLTPVAWARMLQEQIPGSRLTVLPDLGHMLAYEATGTVTDAWPVAQGEVWTSDYGTLPVRGLTLTIARRGDTGSTEDPVDLDDRRVDQGSGVGAVWDLRHRVVVLV